MFIRKQIEIRYTSDNLNFWKWTGMIKKNHSWENEEERVIIINPAFRLDGAGMKLGRLLMQTTRETDLIFHGYHDTTTTTNYSATRGKSFKSVASQWISTSLLVT